MKHRALVILCVAAGVVACAGDGPPVVMSSTTTSSVPGGGVSLELLQTSIFTPKCAFFGCHDATTRSEGVDLSSAEDSFNSLVGVPSVCAGRIRVVPGEPEASYLLDKVGAGDDVPCSDIMPLGAPRLDDAEVALLRAWIAEGAVPP